MSTFPNPTESISEPQAHAYQIELALRHFHPPGTVFEIRIPGEKTVTGYFNDPSLAAQAIVSYDSSARPKAIYTTLQRLGPEASSRCSNQFGSAASTSDAEVAGYQWILIDLDPERPKHTSSSDEELRATEEKARQVGAWLVSRGVPEPLQVMSGNGHHLYLRVELPAEDKDLVQRFLKGLDRRFSGSRVKVDTGVYNPSRITKIAGTIARKGTHTAERPHRLARVLNPEVEPEVVPRELLEKVIEELSPPQTQSTPVAGSGGNLSLPQLTPIRTGCAFIEHCHTDASDLSEGEWFAGLSIVARCEDGENLGHRMSQPYPGYDPLETEKKIRHVLDGPGPWTCQTIQDELGFEGCGSCPHRGKIRSPIRLGYVSKDDEWITVMSDDATAVADAFLEHNYTHDGVITLVCVAKDFYAWDGVCYRTRSGLSVRSELHRWLRKVCTQMWDPMSQEMRQIPVVSSKSKLDNYMDAIVNTTQREINIAQRCWLDGEGNGVDAERLICCQNGLLDFETRRLYPLNPNFFTTIALDIEYDPDAPAPRRFLEMLDSQWEHDPESKRVAQQWAGYCVSGDISCDKMLMFVGPPRSGKGAFARVLTNLLGRSNVVSASLSTFGDRFSIQGWRDKSLAIFSDARSGSSNAAGVEFLLQIVGRDAVCVEQKYRDPIVCTLGTRVMILSNSLPKFYESSGALAARILLLRTTQSFVGREDPDMEAQFDQEKPGILNWALDGNDDLRKSRRFAVPQSLEGDRQRLEEFLSPVRAFMREEGLVADPSLEITKQMAFDLWNKWCDQEGRKLDWSKKALFNELQALVPNLTEVQSRHFERQRVWRGIGFPPPQAQAAAAGVTGVTGVTASYPLHNSSLIADETMGQNAVTPVTPPLLHHLSSEKYPADSINNGDRNSESTIAAAPPNPEPAVPEEKGVTVDMGCHSPSQPAALTAADRLSPQGDTPAPDSHPVDQIDKPEPTIPDTCNHPGLSPTSTPIPATPHLNRIDPPGPALCDSHCPGYLSPAPTNGPPDQYLRPCRNLESTPSSLPEAELAARLAEMERLRAEMRCTEPDDAQRRRLAQLN